MFWVDQLDQTTAGELVKMDPLGCPNSSRKNLIRHPSSVNISHLSTGLFGPVAYFGGMVQCPLWTNPILWWYYSRQFTNFVFFSLKFSFLGDERGLSPPPLHTFKIPCLFGLSVSICHWLIATVVCILRSLSFFVEWFDFFFWHSSRV